MKILNFDTALEKTYITLSDNDNILASEVIENNNGQYHSAFLIPTIAEILKKEHLQIKDLDLIATNTGPGSFTGIRACLVVARTLCQQNNIKALGVSSLKILAEINTTSKNSYVLLDARKNMAYVALLTPNGDYIETPTAKYTDDILQELQNNDYFVITDDKMSELCTQNNIVHINYKDANYNLGKLLNNIAQSELKKNEQDFNWAKLKPLYIQPPPISKPKNVTINN